jgi:5-methyltetrahydrofolate--homocysteine methyltransferase
MVPAERILKTALDEQANMIGLSGLITPSLDEMVHVAREMQRLGLELPLLIGGATTSRQHTAVKIAPEYRGTTVHVHDASRAVGVVASLLDARERRAFDEKNRGEQARLRELHGGEHVRRIIRLEEARARRPALSYTPQAKPERTGSLVISDYPLAEIARYIDWTFLFAAWELRGKFPRILEHPEHGAVARELYENAQALFRRIIERKLLKASAVYGLWPAASDGDDIVLYADDTRTRELLRFNMLRQQSPLRDDEPCRSLADFVATAGSGLNDFVGAFAVTAGHGADDLAHHFEAELDDYDAIMAKALADRLAEAFAELLHQRVRHEWGYAPDEKLTHEELIEEKPGYSAGLRLPGVPGPRETEIVRAPRRAASRHRAHRDVRHAARGERQRHLSRAPAIALLQRRPHRSRSGDRLRATQGRNARRDRARARAESRLRPGRSRSRRVSHPMGI